MTLLNLSLFWMNWDKSHDHSFTIYIGLRLIICFINFTHSLVRSISNYNVWSTISYCTWTTYILSMDPLFQLDSLKPKESLVIRQRYGLDGKGDRTLGEIAGNLGISREMVRKHEVKALMKLKHPTRVDYLRQYVVWNNESTTLCIPIIRFPPLNLLF